MAALHTAGTFGLFAILTVLGGFYFVYSMKSTEGLTSEMCKELYYPDDLKKKALFDEVNVEETEKVEMDSYGVIMTTRTQALNNTITSSTVLSI